MARTQTDINISLPTGVSTVQWSEQRITELQHMIDLIFTMSIINQSSGFIERVQKCVDLAQILSARGDDASFATWLRDVCAERKEQP